MKSLTEMQSMIFDTLLHQLRTQWTDVDESIIRDALPEAMKAIEEGFYGLPN